LLLDTFLERPTLGRLLAFAAASLACAYTLYVAGVVLLIAAGALVVEDCYDSEYERRRIARRLLLWSPLLLGALLLAYLPWWPVVLEASRRAPFVPAAPLTLSKVGQTFSFFAFAPSDGVPLSPGGLLYGSLVVAGALLAFFRPRLRFLAAWALLGFTTIEILGRIHPHYDASRRFLPAGIAFPGLAALAVAQLWRTTRARPIAAAVLVVLLALDGEALSSYYRAGRPDWRPVAAFLRKEALPTEAIFAENQATQLCVGFYLRNESPHGSAHSILGLDGELQRLVASWPLGSRAWLVLAGGKKSEELRRWAEPFPEFPFPSADGYAVVKRLDPSLRDEAMRRVR
jgi:hypothetical protein